MSKWSVGDWVESCDYKGISLPVPSTDDLAFWLGAGGTLSEGAVLALLAEIHRLRERLAGRP